MNFWHKESSIIGLQRRLETMFDMRAAMAEKRLFTEQVGILRRRIRTLITGKDAKDEMVKQNWEDLKMMSDSKRGKR